MAQQFAKVEKRTSKVVTVQGSPPNLTDAEKNTHEIKTVSESVRPGDYLDTQQQAKSEAEDRKAREAKAQGQQGNQPPDPARQQGGGRNPNPRQQAEGTKGSEPE